MGLADDPIKVKGLREFQAALKNMDGETQKKLRVVLNSVSETVVSGARRRVPRRTGKAAGSYRVQSSQREAKLTAGSKKVPYVGWLEFGGRIGRDKMTRRPFVQGGRYMYPTYAANRPSIQTALEKGLADLARSAGLEVS